MVNDIVGTIVHDKYEVLERMSHGGMGVVYKARHIALDTLVALKVLLKKEEHGAQQRFLSEARLASKVRHPNTVFIADVGELEDGRAFLEMEFLSGHTLAVEMQRGPIKVVRACQIAMQIARGLHAVHDKGIIHRDMKPDNVFLLEQDGSFDFVKILDFGIAKVAQGIEASSAASGSVSPIDAASTSGLNPLPETEGEGAPAKPSDSYTLPGKVMGTPGYMAPEQLQALALDVRVDQYALGCILYQMIAGKPVHHARGLQMLMMRHLTDTPVSLRKRAPTAGVPESLDALVMRLLERDPKDRFSSMREVERRLQREIEKLGGQLPGSRPQSGEARAHVPPPPKSRLPIYGAAAAMVVILLGLSYVVYRRAVHKPPIAELETSPHGLHDLSTLRRRAITVLREDLRGTSQELRWSALSALSQTRDPELLPELEAVLMSGDPQTEAQAATALGMLGDRRAIPVLSGLLEHPSGSDRPEPSQVKAAAAGALRQLGDPRGQRFLEHALSAKDPDMQFRAAVLFCEQGPPDVPRVLRAYLSRNGLPENTRLGILSCLAKAGDATALQRLRSLQTEVGPVELQLAAAVKLAQLGDIEGFKFLRELFHKRDREQVLAARELALLEEVDGLELFRQIAENKEAKSLVRQLACDGLGAIGEPSDIRRLIELLDERERPLRQAGARAILQIIGRDPSMLSDQSMSWVHTALLDNDVMVRESAAAILGDSLNAGAVTLLANMLKDRDSRVRRGAVKALGRRKEDLAVNALREALRDTDREVRTESLRSLLRIGDALKTARMAKVVPALREALYTLSKAGQEVSIAERILASAVLLRMGDLEQDKRLRTWLTGADAEARALALEQLSLSGDELIARLKDLSARVRFLAARRLAALGDTRAIPVLNEMVVRGGADGIAAYSLLRRLGAQSPAADPIERLLADSEAANRLEAVEALAALPMTQAEPFLLRASRDPVPQVRLMVAEVTADLSEAQGGIEAPAILRRLSEDPDAAVRARAAMLLSRVLRLQAKVESAALGEGSSDGRTVADAAAGGAADAAADAALTTDGPPAAGTPVVTPPATPPAEPPTSARPASESGAETEPAAPTSGTGLLVVETQQGVQFQLDHRPWQVAGTHPISIAAGSHSVNFLSGQRTVNVTAGQTTRVTLPASQIEQLASAGLESYKRGDYKKAQRQLERAIGLCSRDRDRQHTAVCAGLSFELLFRLGQIYEQQKDLPQAMTDYQRMLSLSGQVHGKSELKLAAQQAVAHLMPQLGQIVVSKQGKSGCQEETLWVRPGRHSIKVASKFEQLQVRAHEVVRTGSCQ